MGPEIVLTQVKEGIGGFAWLPPATAKHRITRDEESGSARLPLPAPAGASGPGQLPAGGGTAGPAPAETSRWGSRSGTHAPAATTRCYLLYHPLPALPLSQPLPWCSWAFPHLLPSLPAVAQGTALLPGTRRRGRGDHRATRGAGRWWLSPAQRLPPSSCPVGSRACAAAAYTCAGGSAGHCPWPTCSLISCSSLPQKGTRSRLAGHHRDCASNGASGVAQFQGACPYHLHLLLT